MTDVLLAHSYFLRFDPKQMQKMRPYMPLATLYVASALRADGYDVALFDAMLSAGEHEFEELLEQTKPSVVVLFEDNFNFLSKMCLSRMREAAITMARRCHDCAPSALRPCAARRGTSDPPTRARFRARRR